MVNFVVNTFLTVFQFILRVFEKAICCFRKRRRLSNEPVPLTNIGVIPNNTEKDSGTFKWSSWDNSTEKVPSIVTKPLDPVQQQIGVYRQQRIAVCKNEENNGTKIDYFQDMIPKIVKQTKICLEKNKEEYVKTNNFSLAPDPAYSSIELGVWEDIQSWEDQTLQDWNANDMIKEKKREERIAKQQKKKIERKSRTLIKSYT